MEIRPVGDELFHADGQTRRSKYSLDARGSVHDSIIHKEKSNKIQQCIKNLFHIYMKLNIFRATHRPSSGT